MQEVVDEADLNKQSIDGFFLSLVLENLYKTDRIRQHYGRLSCRRPDFYQACNQVLKFNREKSKVLLRIWKDRGVVKNGKHLLFFVLERGR